jgi:Fe2+ transport system protein B
MSVKIDVRGLEELQRKLNEMQEGLAPQKIQEFAAEIEEEARHIAEAEAQLSQDAKDSMHIQVVEVKPKRFQLRARPKKEALPFMATATRDKLHKMPVTSQPIFRAFLEAIDKNLQKK